MILIDTSAWVDFLRGVDNEVAAEVDRLLDGPIATTDAVVMEVLAGARDEPHLNDLRRLLARASRVPTQSAHYETGAGFYRTCRRKGATVRSAFDCLIAAVAIDAEMPVLHSDRDFDRIAQHTALTLHRP